MKKDNTDTKTSTFTSVNTVYARVAMILLAVNLCLTGYALVRITDATGGESEQTYTPATAPAQTGVADDPQAVGREEGGE